MHAHADNVWHYGDDNPLPFDEAVEAVAAMLVHLIASIDDPNERIDATRYWNSFVKKAVPRFRKAGRYYTAGQSLVGTVQ